MARWSGAPAGGCGTGLRSYSRRGGGGKPPRAAGQAELFTTMPPVRARHPRARSPRGQSKEESMEHTQGRRPVFELEEEREAAKIKVIGLGGGGSKAVHRMMAASFTGVHFIVGNTPLQALRPSPPPVKLQLGPPLTRRRRARSR